MTDAPKLRIDKWLWQARFFKTRALASKVVSSGKVRVDGVPISKPSRSIASGSMVNFPQGSRVRVVKVLALGERRGPAPEAQALYEDHSPPPPEKPLAARGPNPSAGPRPSRQARAQRRLE